MKKEKEKKEKNESVGCELRDKRRNSFFCTLENDTHKMHRETDSKEEQTMRQQHRRFIILFGIRESANETFNYLPFPGRHFEDSSLQDL